MLILLDAYAPPPTRYSGGKLVASFRVDDSGNIKKEIDKMFEKEREEEEMLEVAILAYWRKNE